MCAIIVRSFQI